VSGSLGMVEAETFLIYKMPASFTEGTFNGNTLAGTLTITFHAQDAPLVINITLTN
jgi:hypothetical protein